MFFASSALLGKRVLVIGSLGNLGKTVTKHFLDKKWEVLGTDIIHSDNPISVYKRVAPEATIEQIQGEFLSLVGSKKLDAIVNVAGGWAGGSIADKTMAASTEQMLRQSVFTSIAASHVLATNGAEGCLLLLTGASAAKEETPSMIGYGIAKAAVHKLCETIAKDSENTPKDSRVVAILPSILDTPSNRAAMPDADTSTWTPLEEVATQIVKWSERVETPENGSLIAIKTVDHKSFFVKM